MAVQKLQWLFKVYYLVLIVGTKFRPGAYGPWSSATKKIVGL
jgi:hypothetical protein